MTEYVWVYISDSDPVLLPNTSHQHTPGHISHLDAHKRRLIVSRAGG